MRPLVVAPLLLVIAPACQPPPASATATDEPLLTTTMVTLDDDGTSEIAVLSETQAQRGARLERARTSGATPQITSEPCTDATYTDLYLCDTSNANCSGGNVACIYGYGALSLASVPRAGGTWNAAVRQYEPDAWSGRFRVTSGLTCAEAFGAGYVITPAGSCAQRADTVQICKGNGSICSSPAQCCSGRCSATGLLRACY